MKSFRSALAVGCVVVLGASCASLLGIQDPETVGRGGAGGKGASGSGGGPGAGASTGTNLGGSASAGGSGGQQSSSSNGGGGGMADCGVFTFCPNAQPQQCVDTSTDRANCGMCDHACDPTRACVLSQCATPHPLTPNYQGVLGSVGNDFVATSLSVPAMGAHLVVGGTLAGNDPFGDGTTQVMRRDPFVWQTQISPRMNGPFDSICHLKGNCGSLTSDHSALDVAISNQQNTQLVGDFGLASFDAMLGLANLDVGHPGVGLGLANSSGVQLALADNDAVTVLALNNGVPVGTAAFWPISISPPSTVPVHLARFGTGVIVTGGLDGPGTATLGDGTAAVTGARDAFLGAYDAMGNLSWFKTFASASGASASVDAVFVDGADVYIAGQYQTSIDTGPGAGPGLFCGVLQTTPGETADFIAKFDINGHCTWARSFGSADPSADRITGILEFGAGNVMVVGATTATSANLGGQDLQVPSPLFLLIVNDGDGTYEYSWSFGNDPAMQATGQPVGVATRTLDDVWIAGFYSGGAIADLGLPSVNAGRHASYVVHFASTEFP